MVQSDTVVGIVGAVILVGVMAAVFVYEYNNEATGTGAAPSFAQFAQDYPFLNATQDLDNDNTPNHLDSDLDGDGLENAQDRETGVTVPLDGSVPAGSVAESSVQFNIGTGEVHLVAFIDYESTTPAPLPPLTTLRMRLLDPDGAEVASATGTNAGGTLYEVEFEVTDPLDPGTYTIAIGATSQGNSGASWGGDSVQVHYKSSA